MKTRLSIVILTRSRVKIVLNLLTSLIKLRSGEMEIIVVDNASDDGTVAAINQLSERITVISLQSNQGAVARNHGIRKAGGDIIITMDDDVYGLTDSDLDRMEMYFGDNPKLGALNFKVIDEKTHQISNWCHPFKQEVFSDRFFHTCEISEGAVVFRRSALEQTGYYPEAFFISNEGSDLACRLLNYGYDIGFSPDIEVLHKFSEESREPWRRYYYDTRNHFWLAIRNFHLGYGFRYVLSKVGIMMVYSIRDGYLSYWFKGIIDAARGMGPIYRSRQPLTPAAEERLGIIRANKPGFLYMLRRRLAERKIKI